MLSERVPTTYSYWGDYDNTAQEYVSSDLTDYDLYGHLFDEDKDTMV